MLAWLSANLVNLVICAVLIFFWTVEKNLAKEQAEIKARKG